jgi:N-acetyl-D-muramate 6-phosphate phosphatase
MPVAAEVMLRPRPAALLFDLDGTLVDSAPDLAGTANDMRRERGLPPLDLQTLRPHAGSGARGMLGAGLDVRPGDARYAALRDEFHDRYEARMLQCTRPFDGSLALLVALDRAAWPWAVVTNKARRFAAPLTAALDIAPAVLVCGDTTPHTKPHPAPLLEAARLLGVAAADCVYLGDDRRDMQAAQAAGMPGWVAGWGYIGPDEDSHAWGGQRWLASADELLQTLELA